VLELNAAAAPAVAAVDASELARLMGLSARHLAALQPDGGLAGYALVFASDDPYDGEEFLALRSSITGPFLYVDQVAVAEQCRGTGVGRRLYDEIALRARQRGAHTLCCEVNISPPNPGSLAFHARMGFTRIGDLATQDGREVALLSRTL
jgi:predicted GNAT superfamily acetyltransferase